MRRLWLNTGVAIGGQTSVKKKVNELRYVLPASIILPITHTDLKSLKLGGDGASTSSFDLMKKPRICETPSLEQGFENRVSNAVIAIRDPL